MKKFLSLVLALVMTMSLVTISAGAKDFTDDAEINYDEAVAVVSEIGVIDGYTDGSFGPANNLTRQAAAKIICNLILGPTTAAALSADTAPYPDVPVTNDFAGYIAYLKGQGLISGYGDGEFKGGNGLTGYAFLKMLLGALGYDSEIEGFVGANWSVNVAKVALSNKLTSGIEGFNGIDSVNREEACQMVFNTLKADMVEYDSKTTVNVAGAEVVIGNSDAKKISDEDEAGYDNTLNKDNLQFAEMYFPKLTRTLTETDAFGRPAAEWKFKSTIIGTYNDDSDLIGTYTAKAKKGDLVGLVGSSTVKGITNGDYDLVVWLNGEEVADNDDVTDYFVKNSSAAAGVSGNGVLTEVYMDDDNNVTIIQINTYLVQATADYNEKKETLSIEAIEINEAGSVTPNVGTSISNDDIVVSEFKEDDYILVTYSEMTDEIESAVLAESVTGAVSEYTVKDYVIIDETKYSYNKLVGDAEKSVDYSIGEDAVVILDEYGYVIYVDESVSTNSYLWIQKTVDDSGLNKKFISAAYMTDGTYEEIVLNKENGEKSNVDEDVAGWYTFSKTSAEKYNVSNEKLILDEASTDYDGAVITNGKVKFIAGADVKGNSSTVVIVIDEDGDPTVYTGIKNIPDVTAEGAVVVEWVENTSGYAKYVVVDLSDADESYIDDQGDVADFMMLLKPTGNKTVAGEDTYYQYKVLLDGEVVTKYVEETIVDGEEKGDLFYSVKSNAKGYIVSAKNFVDDAKDEYATTVLSATEIKFSGDTLTVGSDEYIVADGVDADLVIADASDLLMKDEAADYETYLGISARALAGTLSGYTVDGSFYAILDDEDKEVITAIYVYVDNSAEVVENVGGDGNGSNGQDSNA